MELPNHIKALYKHWDHHTLTICPGAMTASIDAELFRDIQWLIRERIAIWKRKTSEESPPYTADPILAKYKFCNIFREFDRQTITFHALLNPLRDNFPLWLLNMFYCRMVARPETITHTGLLSFDAAHNEQLHQRLMRSPRPRFGTPYVFPISVIQKSNYPTREKFIGYYLPQSMQAMAAEIAQWQKESVYHGLEKLLPLFGYNLRFLWTEVLIDVAYQYPTYIDLFARFPIGPGSLPTMRKLDPRANPTLLVQKLALLGTNTGLTYEESPIRLSAENWEGIGCEYRKYTNLKAGYGRKRLYIYKH